MSPALRGAAIALIVTVVTVLCGCGQDETSAADHPGALRRAADGALAALPGVTRIDLTATPSEDSVDLGVVMDVTSSVDQIAVAAEEAQTFSEDNAAETKWTTHLYVGDPLQIEVYPSVHASASADARAAWAAIRIEGVQSVAVDRGTPYVTAKNVGALAAVLEQVRASPLWTDGGSLQAGDGRVRLMDAPERVTLAQLAAIVDAARAHPAGEFWLEAAAAGDRWPELYVNRVSAAEAADITERFADQALRSTSADDYELEYTMRAYDTAQASRQVDTTGVMGWG